MTSLPEQAYLADIPPAAIADPSSGGGLASVDRAALSALPAWKAAFRHLRKDSRYYEIVEHTICPEFDYKYFAIKDESGVVSAIQPYFLLDQDLLAGAGPRAKAFASAARRLWPRFLKMRTMMVGCAAGEGHLDAQAATARRAVAETLAAGIVPQARRDKASLIVCKEFPAEYRDAMSSFLRQGFFRAPSMPMTRLDISAYSSFEDYLNKAIKSKRRTEFRRKFKAAEQSSPIELEVAQTADGVIDEIYALYEQTLARSSLQFEILTKAYFLEIGRRMPEAARFFIWRQNGKIIAFSLCLLQGDALYGEYLGLDYEIALELHLYFYVMRDIISWAIENGFKSIVSTSLGYAPKLQMRHALLPLDLYIRHVSPLANAVFKLFLPWIEPTSGEPILKQFPNYADLWADRP
jgi:predicted N-acyltransferase